MNALLLKLEEVAYRIRALENNVRILQERLEATERELDRVSSHISENQFLLDPEKELFS